MDRAEIRERVLKGDQRAIARAATLVENRMATPLLRELFPHTGKALVIGITGSPGAGKSTFASHLTRVLRAEGKRVGVIAVDPTSPYSGGAILGDRIRMLEHYADPGVFIRSMATRGWLGGLAPAAADMTVLFDAAGCDVVIVETVGVGQDEVEIAKLADVTLVALTPNAGDDVQALKAGIMEIADVFVLNKSDLDGADKLERELKASFTLSHRPDGWMPLVVRTVAGEGKGIAEVLAAVREYQKTGLGERKRGEVWAVRLREMLRERLLERYDPTVFEQAARAVDGARDRSLYGDRGVAGKTMTHQAEIGIIGGSGLYSMPGFTVEEECWHGDAVGRSVGSLHGWGRLSGRKVAFLARHGRGHRISPSELNFRANIYGMKKLGVTRILSLSAVGSLKEEHHPLEFVIPDQFFDRTRGRVSRPSLEKDWWRISVSPIRFARKWRRWRMRLARRWGLRRRRAERICAWRVRRFRPRRSRTCTGPGAWT